MLNTLGYLWEYANSHPKATNFGIRREYERIPTMAGAYSTAASQLIARRGLVPGARDGRWLPHVARYRPYCAQRPFYAVQWTLHPRRAHGPCPVRADVLYVLFKTFLELSGMNYIVS